MLLGEIKLMALRLMFADTDITYDIAQMEDYYSNNNTREKLMRMNDSINRAISLYYQRVGSLRGVHVINLEASGTGYSNRVNLPAQISNVDNVLKVRITPLYSYPISNADFEFDGTTLVLTNLLPTITESQKNSITIEAFVEYKKSFVNSSDSDVGLDLDTLHIPTDVQLAIPNYVKGELYEEDEPQMALYAKNEYLNFLTLVKKPQIIKQQRVVKPNWNK